MEASERREVWALRGSLSRRQSRCGGEGGRGLETGTAGSESATGYPLRVDGV